MPKRNTKRVIDRNHLIKVSQLPCCLMGLSSEWCKGVVQAHHLLKPYDGNRGLGMKANDNNVVPLCQYHHTLLHDKYGNEDKFWTINGQDADFGRNVARTLWEKYKCKKV